MKGRLVAVGLPTLSQGEAERALSAKYGSPYVKEIGRLPVNANGTLAWTLDGGGISLAPSVARRKQPAYVLYTSSEPDPNANF